MNARTIAIAICLMTLPATPSATAEEASETPNGLQKQIDELKLKNELMQVKYGAALQGRPGDITGSDKVSGVAQQRALMLSGEAARDLGLAIGSKTVGCPSVLLTDDANFASKATLAASIDDRLKTLQQRLDELEANLAKPVGKRSRSVAASAALIQGIAGSIVGVWSLFQSDYDIASFTLENDPDWITANILAGHRECTKGTCGPEPLSTRFPSSAEVTALIGDLNTIVATATTIKKDVDRRTDGSKKEADLKLRSDAASVLDEVTAMRETLLTADAAGAVPIASIVPYRQNSSKQGCTVKWSDSSPDSITLTKKTVFGKLGRVYLNTAVQYSAIVMSADGKPSETLCRQRAMATTLKLSSLTNAKPVAPPWDDTSALSPSPIDCAADWSKTSQ